MKTIEASVEAVLIADHPETFVTRRIPETRFEFGGIPGDRHFGITRPADSRQPMYPRGTEIFNRRQITVLSAEECMDIAEKLQIDSLLPEWLGANLLLRGVPDLTSLTIGSRLLFPSGAGLVCQGENLPCTLPGKVIQEMHTNRPELTTEFVRAAFKQRGIVCLVECPGQVRQGDLVRILVNDFAKPLQ
ncbi:MOSC domain-containing protein [Paenactinomyces guangxiensis]|uniref:MOSC domain-containing protein n=1 Tax=Paenactinomyces guangxiensis TaxID=1490290 RepID=A0A7W1WSB2_9BACL|nr:MOSC domain-containing protein [Paenactinomyces guangxiensis]MBA4495058.1 MOSC domain-containing protein [Paenactinomyces guangxiensis]MBH8592258.1 MOSC domain-containing protein [Paenactinomyces guangxiensis]